jgi:hypothetical protein
LLTWGFCVQDRGLLTTLLTGGPAARRRRCPVHGNTYEVDAALDGRRVDPFDLSDLKVRSQSRDIRGAAIRHQIGRRVHPAAKPETEPWLEQLSVP